ncbi:HD-GYP domain-containing protein (c-di-GMP phosphodiesterase class II) [Bradymonas sediminis]|uniref:Uncharacterized protein n=1 Tax=Bradymonas sediminis TaxID=1548548 RepID=A0A2Z4FGZ1_9DELT|nr:hypothetical protein DN745_02310 [Bradymonas sediminis]TDP77355.1 HD-GYP domain-containing protein (c-di-GMP phosphodiesterase class II) [Bradymonas sediminis]
MTNTRSEINEYQRVKLTVISGPDVGLMRRFVARQCLGVGRGARNDLILSDGYVSNTHGELCFEDGGLVYRDLRSRHGTLVRVGEESVQLKDASAAQHIFVNDGAEIQVGRTLMRVEFEKIHVRDSGDMLGGGGPPISRPNRGADIDDYVDDTSEVKIKEWAETSPSVSTEMAKNFGGGARVGGPRLGSSNARPVARGPRETMITTAMPGVQTIPQNLARNDDSLAILFRLAGELNSQTQLDDILRLIVDAIFDAFDAANFFAITLADEPEDIAAAEPFLTRVRGKLPGKKDKEQGPLLSKSILRQVVESRESVLFVRDSLGDNISQSILDAQITACLCAPLQGQHSLLGIMQVDTRGMGGLFSKADLDLFSVFASNVAFALERAQLSDNIVEIFESFVAASVNAIEARDPTTAGHSQRVADYTVEFAETVNEVQAGVLAEVHMDRRELKELRYAALLHDFGKIAVPESVLGKEKRLAPDHLVLLAQRFETVKTLHYQRLIRGHFGKQQDALSAAHFQELEARYARDCAKIDQDLAFIMRVAEAPFLEDAQIERIKQIGARHYIGVDGKRCPLLTPFEVENLCIRRGTLNPEQWESMRSHARRSEQYLEQIPWGKELKKVPCIAGAHHEKLDGSGYPNGLVGPDILPQVRMLTIADIFDALTAADRPYRKAATADGAVRVLRMEAEDNKLDKDLVEVFALRVVPKLNLSGR